MFGQQLHPINSATRRHVTVLPLTDHDSVAFVFHFALTRLLTLVRHGINKEDGPTAATAIKGGSKQQQQSLKKGSTQQSLLLSATWTWMTWTWVTWTWMTWTYVKWTWGTWMTWVEWTDVIWVTWMWVDSKNRSEVGGATSIVMFAHHRHTRFKLLPVKRIVRDKCPRHMNHWWCAPARRLCLTCISLSDDFSISAHECPTLAQDNCMMEESNFDDVIIPKAFRQL